MRKALFFAACLIVLSACKKEQPAPVAATPKIEQNDSLQKIIEQRENEINDLMATFNQIQEGLRQIAEAEDHVALAQDGEGTDRMKQITQNIQFIQKKMNENRELIEKMREQLRQSSLKGDELKKTIEGLVAQLEEKDRKLQQLRAELNSKDIHIGELDQAIADLNSDVEGLKSESKEKSKTISEQDKLLHMAYYVFGTKNELKEQKILDKGEVLRSDYNKNYFTKIDTRVEKEIKLYSKSAKLLTSHPTSSYTLAADASGLQVLRINDPEKFWHTNKYLVILVK
jgi:chromosome segregation ATPase